MNDRERGACSGAHQPRSRSIGRNERMIEEGLADPGEVLSDRDAELAQMCRRADP